VKEIRTYHINRWPAGKQQWRERRTLHRETQVVRELRAGEPFGEESMLIDEANLFSFVARTPCIVLSLHRANLGMITSSLRTLALLRRRARRHLAAGAPDYLDRLGGEDTLLPGETAGAGQAEKDGEGDRESPWGSEDEGAMSPSAVEQDHDGLQPMTMEEEAKRAQAVAAGAEAGTPLTGDGDGSPPRGSRRVRFAVD